MKDNLKLTVNVITYNHEQYIEECLDSILKQKVDFNFVVRIFDDASTDKTPEICKRYKNRYPEKIELYLAERNLGRLDDGTLVNAMRSYENITTPYYLFIEGDDYCKDIKRFAKQVKVLEMNENCVCCCGRVETFDDNTKEIIGVSPKRRHKYALQDIINTKEYFHVQHSGKMIRTSAIDINKEHPHYFLFDITQMYELIQKGDIYFIDSVVSVYRLVYNNPNSIYAGLTYKEQCNFLFNMILGYDEYTQYKFSRNLYNNMLIELEGKYYHYYEKEKIIKINKLNDNLKSIKHYFIPRFILDIFNVPRNVSRILRQLLKHRRK